MQPPLERITRGETNGAWLEGPALRVGAEELLGSSLGNVTHRHLIEIADASTLPRHCGGFHTQWTASHRKHVKPFIWSISLVEVIIRHVISLNVGSEVSVLDYLELKEATWN